METQSIVDWHALRQQKLTASTFAAAVGFFRERRVQLWLEKIGAVEPFDSNPATRWSDAHSVIALERYAWITGNSISFPSFHEYRGGATHHPHRDYLAASADAVVVHAAYGAPFNGILEIKCPYFSGRPEEAYPWKRIPVHYMPQAQGLMAIMDCQWMDIYCWTPNGSSLFRVLRNDSYWNVLERALSDFWWKHVRPAKEVRGRIHVEDPVRELRLFVPAPKHELCQEIVYASMALRDEAKLLIREIRGELVG